MGVVAHLCQAPKAVPSLHMLALQHQDRSEVSMIVANAGCQSKNTCTLRESPWGGHKAPVEVLKALQVHGDAAISSEIA